VIVFIALVALLALGRLAIWRRGPREPAAPPAHGGHPESMTAVLEPGAEEYLAWLAYHHWPHDEYLDLEHDWQTELDSADTLAEPVQTATCPGCHQEGEDVWPCRMCGQVLHSACGHGMRRRRVARPYRTRDMNAEAVIAEWLCTNCSSVVGLDTDDT
jgi:hypothetical protein